jgi:O-antigen/teichoic acid export membrane protein
VSTICSSGYFHYAVRRIPERSGLVEESAELMPEEGILRVFTIPLLARNSWTGFCSNKFIRNAGIIGGGSALGHLFTLAAGPILTRVYGPDEFGALGLFTSLLSILAVAATLQYEISIVIGKDEQEAAYLTFGSLLLTIPVSLLGGGFLWLLIHESLLGYGSLPWFAPILMTVSVALIGCFSALRYWTLREGQFAWIAQASVAQSSTRAILQTVFGFVGLRLFGLLLGETLGRGMGISRTLRGSWPVLRRHAQRFQWHDLACALGRHRKFPLYSFPSSFLDAVCVGFPLPLLVYMYGVSFGGQYSLVWKAVSVPSVLISAAVADTFHNTLATCARETPKRVMRLFCTSSVGLFLVGLFPAIALILWGQMLFACIFGARWASAGTMAAIIAPWYLAQFVVSPLSRVVVVLSGQESKLAWDVLCLASLALVFFIAHSMRLAPLQTLRVLTATYALLYVAYYLILRQIIVRFNRLHSSTNLQELPLRKEPLCAE